MKFFITLYLLSTLLTAANPTVYSVLGDGIYNNVGNISKLKEMPNYIEDKERVDAYIRKVYAAKKIGHAIEQGDESVDKLTYLNTLRELSKENDYYVRSAHSDLRAAMNNENSELFSTLINSGLIDTPRYKDEIINYYMGHVEEINPEGVIQNFINEDKYLKKEEVANQKIYKSQQQRQKEKIQKIREQDVIEQKAFEQSLQKEVDQKKSEIRVNQIKELSQ
jgi:hypothetical protein